MLLVFNKIHANEYHSRVGFLNLKNEMGTKVCNATTLTFEYSACINGRFERKLQRFINRLPWEYFAVSPQVFNDKRNNTGKSKNHALTFTQGACDAKKIKHAIIKAYRIEDLKL